MLRWSSPAASVLLALVFAAITVRMVSQLIRGMEFQTAELGRVSWHMLEDQEATARRFSHELHDELGQSLTAIKTNLAALDSSGQPARARLDDCLHLVDEAIGNVRQMSQLLRPTILDDFGLEAGLRWLAEGFAARTGIEVDFQSQLSPAACRTRPRRTCSASRRRRSPTWRATPAPRTWPSAGIARPTRSAWRSATMAAASRRFRRRPQARPGLGPDRDARARPQRGRRGQRSRAAGRGCCN